MGYNGTGKSTFCRKMVDHAVKSGRRALIVTPHDMEWQDIPFLNTETDEIKTFTGIRRIIYDDGTLDFLVNYRRGVLVFDDCRVYLKSNTNPQIHRLLISRRQQMLDLIAVGHGFTEVPPKFFTFSSEIILFKTLDNIAKRKDVIKDFEKMVKAQYSVNEMAVTKPHHYEIIKQD